MCCFCSNADHLLVVRSRGFKLLISDSNKVDLFHSPELTDVKFLRTCSRVSEACRRKRDEAGNGHGGSQLKKDHSIKKDPESTYFFVALACHQLVLDGLINIFKLFHTLGSAID